VFERASGEPLTKGISGLFTKEGYRKAFETSVDKATRQLAAEETWVLGLRPSDASKSLPLGKANPELTNRVRRLYFEEYIKVWDKYIADVRVVKLDSLDKSLQVARQLCARRPWSSPSPRSARPAAPRSATSTRRPSRPSARWPRCSAR